METPADYVRRVLEESGLSVRQAADRAKKQGRKISFTYLDEIVKGFATNPTVKSVQAIAAALGRPEDEVFAVFRGVPYSSLTQHDLDVLDAEIVNDSE